MRIRRRVQPEMPDKCACDAGQWALAGRHKMCCQTKSNSSQSTMITQIYEAQI